MDQYLKDPQFQQELKWVRDFAKKTQRPKKMLVTDQEYAELEESGSDMSRFYPLGNLEHISPIIKRLLFKRSGA